MATYDVVRRFTERPAGLAFVGAWGVAEALSWPLIAELPIASMAPAAPRRWWKLALVLTAGSVAGGTLNYAFARRGVRLPWPLTTPAMHAHVAGELDEEGGAAVRHQPASFIPYKVYARTAGEQGTPLAEFIGWSIVARGSRMALVAGGAAIAGAALRRPLTRVYGPGLALGLGVVFPVALRAAINRWR